MAVFIKWITVQIPSILEEWTLSPVHEAVATMASKCSIAEENFTPKQPSTKNCNTIIIGKQKIMSLFQIQKLF